MISCSRARAASLICTPASLNSRTPHAVNTVAATDPKAAAAHGRTCPARVPMLIVVSLDTGPVVVTVFWVTGAAAVRVGTALIVGTGGVGVGGNATGAGPMAAGGAGFA